MKFTLHKMYKQGKRINPTVPPERVTACIALGDDGIALASRANGVVIDALEVQSVQISTDGIKLIGYEGGDYYYKQQWWLTK